MKTKYIIPLLIALAAIFISRGQAQQIEAGSFNSPTIPKNDTTSYGIETFSISQASPITFQFAGQVTSDVRASSTPFPDETITRAPFVFYVLNVTTNVTTNVSNVFEDDLFFDGVSNVFKYGVPTVSGALNSLPAGTYQLRVRRFNNAVNSPIAQQYRNLSIAGSFSLIAAVAISPQVQAAIDALNQAIAAGDQDLVTQITQVANDLIAVQNQITTINSQIAALQSQNTTQNGQITNLQSGLNTANNSILDLNNTISNLQTQINGQQSQIDGQQSTIDGQQSTIDGQQTQIDGQQSQINGQQTTITGQQSQIDSQGNLITSQQGQLDGQQSTINGQQGQINAQQSQINSLLGNGPAIAKLQQQLASLQGQQTTINGQLQSQIHTLKNRMSSTETISQVGLGVGSAGAGLGVFDLFSGSSGFSASTPATTAAQAPNTTANTTARSTASFQRPGATVSRPVSTYSSR